MGNCWPSPVDTSPSLPKPSTSENNEETLKKMENNKNRDENRGQSAAREVPTTGRIITPNLTQFSYATLKTATRNFRPDTVVGEGGFGKVFKGWVDAKTYEPSKVGVGIAVAVKKSNPGSIQGLQEWQAEVKFLGKFSHPNLVKLLGYCWEDKQFLLVYEYMEKRSLETHLFSKRAEPLPWETRIKIATGAARGLAFLHTTEKQVIYRDFKASNILLDEDFNAKLSDFGLATLGPVDGDSHVTTRIIGTYGYAAPEYIATGHLYVKSDVYGFGVVLLELLTGVRVIDLNRPNGEHNLIEWTQPALTDKRKLNKIMDPRLQNHYPRKAASQAAQLIRNCLESEPKNRPCMEEVLDILHKISAVKMKNPKEEESSKTTPKHAAVPQSRPHHHHPPANYRQNGHDRSPLHRNYGGNGSETGGRARSPLPRSR